MLEILYRDEHLVAVHKPDGIFVHPTRLAPREPSLMPRLRRQMDCLVYPIHRLDRATSGVLLFALSPEAAREACRLFEERLVEKSYLAVVRGFAPENGHIDHALRDKEKRAKEPANAVTDFLRLATAEFPEPVGKHPSARFSLVQAMPLTGRRHQIRRHLAHISHPVLGDTNYGDGAQNRFFRERFQIRRLMLHASRLSFEHPYKSTPVTITAPLPQDIQTLFSELGWQA